LTEISYEKDSFVSRQLQDKFSDLLTSVPVIGREQEANIYFLFEHKSQYDVKTPLQLLRYILEIWDNYDNMVKESGRKLPIIIPVLITHAKGGWGRKRVLDLIDMPSEEFRPYIPDFNFVLFDSIKEDPESYDFAKSLQAILVIWKHYYSPEFIHGLQRAFQIIKQAYPDLKLKDFLEPIMNYLYSVRAEEEYTDIYKVAEKEFSEGDEYMGTIAEMFERKGAQRKEQEYLGKKDKWVSEGKSEGKIENSQEMLIEYIQDELDIPSQDLLDKIRLIKSYDLLRGLFRKARKVNSLDEFAKELNKVL
jgi:predicted transposase/invertase (TIGR01784 family)